MSWWNQRQSFEDKVTLRHVLRQKLAQIKNTKRLLDICIFKKSISYIQCAFVHYTPASNIYKHTFLYSSQLHNSKSFSCLEKKWSCIFVLIHWILDSFGRPRTKWLYFFLSGHHSLCFSFLVTLSLKIITIIIK